MSDVIRMSRDGAVAAITIDRPAEGNVLTTDMLRALTATIRAAAASAATVIALRSTGVDFCRGRDGKGGLSGRGQPWCGRHAFGARSVAAQRSIHKCARQ